MASNWHVAITARGERNGLVQAEAMALTGGTPDADGVAVCERIDRIDRAAYVHRGLRIILSTRTIDELRDAIAARASTIASDRFRIDVHDPERRSPLGRIEMAISLADALQEFPDLRDPLHHFLVIVGEHNLLFGEIEAESTASYRLHDSKPWTTSSSLDGRFSRALINLVPDARSILDPCCGAGSIVVEAASLGIEAFGVDWKPALAGMTRENLAHFGYPGTVVQADSRTHVQHADAIVTDLPYGHAINADEGIIRAILEQSAGLAPRAVFVAPANITTWLTDTGFTNVQVHTVMKRRGFTRWVHVAESTIF
ncbi:TRM11 family SAM-dependent methyltransferase [Ilumatobacter sp.]|uniref:TRM11 family SAM-dependent methyltransferase n=1 Tax=Ilumatobacter sp. TaxID=1967498 RepID=UPI00375393A8